MTEQICACGKELVPLLQEGQQVGVTHKTPEDEEHHSAYFSSLRVEPV